MSSLREILFVYFGRFTINCDQGHIDTGSIVWNVYLFRGTWPGIIKLNKVKC